MNKTSFCFLFLMIGVLCNAEVKTVGDTQDFSLLKSTKKNRPAEPRAERFTKDVVLTLVIKNNTEKTITAWKATMTAKDGFGETILSANINSNDSSIDPNKTENADFVWEDNQFIDDEPYDKLAGISSENLTVTISDCKAVFRKDKTE